MSQANVERLRGFLEQTLVDIPALVEAWERGEADLSIFAPDVVYEDANLPDHIGETYRGHDGMMQAAKRWTEASEVLTIKLREIVGAGDQLVSVHDTYSKARHSGIELEEPLSYVWRFENGRIVHFRSIRDRAEALQVAGISE